MDFIINGLDWNEYSLKYKRGWGDNSGSVNEFGGFGDGQAIGACNRLNTKGYGHPSFDGDIFFYGNGHGFGQGKGCRGIFFFMEMDMALVRGKGAE